MNLEHESLHFINHVALSLLSLFPVLSTHSQLVLTPNSHDRDLASHVVGMGSIKASSILYDTLSQFKLALKRLPLTTSVTGGLSALFRP